MVNSIAVQKRAVQQFRTNLKQVMGALRTPAHLLPFAKPMVNQMIHYRFDMSSRNSAAGSAFFGKIR